MTLAFLATIKGKGGRTISTAITKDCAQMWLIPRSQRRKYSVILHKGLLKKEAL